jgi:hypothetical protein
MWWSVLFIEKEEGFYMHILLSCSSLISSSSISVWYGYPVLSDRTGCCPTRVKASSWLICSCSHVAFESILSQLYAATAAVRFSSDEEIYRDVQTF